jgi:dTDP-4-amino-4,6-dideoxygalactose transaminase
MWRIQLFKLNYDERERDAVNSVLESGWLSMGPRTAAFEADFGKFLGENTKCLAVANATAALHMAMIALDIGPGAEVIVPALTFVADVNSVALTGARPVLADCDSLDIWNVSSSSIENCITAHTKAVVVVHYAGVPCDMTAIRALCDSRGLKLIEDVSHAPGASIAGRMCGTWGDISCFSFFSNKNLSIGEGGMVVTQSCDLYEKLRYIRSHGMTALTMDRHAGRALSYDVMLTGMNCRMDEMRAALGIVQLSKLREANRRRRELAERYITNFRNSVVKVPFCSVPADYDSAFHIFPVLLPEATDRDAVMLRLKVGGVQSSIHYPPFWTFTAYKGKFSASATPVANAVCERELTLPLYPTMTEHEVDIVSTTLLESL